MSGFQIAIFCCAAVSAGLAYYTDLPKAALWAVLIGAVHFITSSYARAGMPDPHFVAAIFDAGVAALIMISIHHEHERWQLLVARVVQGMLLANLVYLGAGQMMDVRFVHQSVLEGLNILAFAIISGTAISDLMGRNADNFISHTLRNFYSFMRTRFSGREAAEG